MSPSHANSIVGIKPTVGLISRTGIVPISNSQDTAGPMTRTVKDAAILLSALAGVDSNDPATWSSAGRSLVDYTQGMHEDALDGAQIGINRGYIEDFTDEEKHIFEAAVKALKYHGAIIVENIHLPHIAEEMTVLLHEFKGSLNAYLSSLPPGNPVRSLQDVIDFNNLHAEQALKYGQSLLLQAQNETSGAFKETKYWLTRMNEIRMSQKQGIDRFLQEHEIDVLFGPGVTDTAAIAGYPSIQVPAGYTSAGKLMGVMFMGAKYEELKLIQLAHAFEQVTTARKPPNFIG